MSRQPFIICIVDDDDIYQFAVRKDLDTLKIPKKILMFNDGDQALEFMLDNLGNKEDLPDLIFLDINMPIMDGFQFMEEYVKVKPRLGKQITVYMVSSSVDPSDIERAKKISEISDYLIKPIDARELGTLVLKLQEDGSL